MKRSLKAHGAGHVRRHRGLVIVDPDLPSDTAEPGEGPHQALVGVLGIAARRRHDVEAARVTQDADSDEDSLSTTGHRDDDLTPVMLQLTAGFSLEANGGPAGPEGAPGLDVGTQDANLAVVSQGLDLTVDDHGVVHAGLQKLVHGCHVRPELGVTLAAAHPGRRPASLESAAHCLAMYPEAFGNLALVDPLVV